VSVYRHEFSSEARRNGRSRRLQIGVLERPASRRWTDLGVAHAGQPFENQDSSGASNEGYRRHRKNSFEHGSLPENVAG
jgi:hypothetical protein